MIETEDPAYLRAREIEEREAAARSSCMVRDVHLELADEYHARAETSEHPETGSMPAAGPGEGGR